MKLGEVAAECSVLDRGQHLVADPLVQRHAAAQRVATVDHPRRDERAGLALTECIHDLGQILGRVLPVAVQEDDIVVALLDGVEIPKLLVAAVSTIEGRARTVTLLKPSCSPAPRARSRMFGRSTSRR